ncbi:hypothetical protein Tco_1004644 [Tanacetum coccineum]|uniref:Uncharacterized protein n=1 Tax=Tanacetum coccineum TaxID=301880 RepID=A0ABQ5FCG6_9ASTR
MNRRQVLDQLDWLRELQKVYGVDLSGLDHPVCLGLTLVKQTQFHLSQLRMSRVGHLHGLIYDGCSILRNIWIRSLLGILACRGLSLVSSPLHAMKSQSQIQSSAAILCRSDSVDLVKWELVDIVKSRVGYSGSEVGRRENHILKGDSKLHFIPAQYQLANIFTKPLDEQIFKRLIVEVEQNPPQQEQPFVAAKQVGFNLEDILLNTNNKVGLLYPEHTNKETFKCVSDFISKCCLREPFTRSPNIYKEYLVEFWYSAKALENSKVSFSIPTGGIYGEVGVNTFKNTIGAHYLQHSSKYVAPSSIDIVRPWFKTIRYGETVPIKGNLKKSLLPPRWRFLSLLMMHKMKEGYEEGEVTSYPTQVFSVNNWPLKPNQPEEPPFTDHMLAICASAKPVVFKAPKPSSNAERVPQGTKPRAKPRHKKHSTSLKQPSVSS